jgi:uncharacterized YccA/Bax inhibitor family protein
MCIVSVSCLLWSQSGFSTHWPGREPMFVSSVSCLLWSLSVALPHTGQVGSWCVLSVFLVYCGTNIGSLPGQCVEKPDWDHSRQETKSGFSTHWPGREPMFVGSVSCLLWSLSVASPHTGQVGSWCVLSVFLVYCGLSLTSPHTGQVGSQCLLAVFLRMSNLWFILIHCHVSFMF